MKKFIAILLTVALTASIAVAGTMAYFTDTEDEINVFTLGNVKIDLVEEQRNADGTALEEFEDGKVLVPVTNPKDPINWPKGENVDGITLPTVENFVDKIVTVDNEGPQDAYVRVLIAFPADMDDDTSADNMMMRWIYDVKEPNGTWSRTGGDVQVTIGGRTYNVYNCTYNAVLTPGKTTASPAITGVFINSGVDATVNEDGSITYFMKDANGNVIKQATYPAGEGPKLYVLTQGVQAAGFADANTALTAGFGAVNADNKSNVQAWFNVVASGEREDIVGLQVITNEEELADALLNGGDYIFGADVITDGKALTVAAGVTVNLDMKGYTLNGAIIVPDTASLTVGNGTIVNKNSDVSCIESYGSLVLNDVNATSARHVIKIESGTVVINGGTYATSDFGATDKVKMTLNTLYVKAGTAIVNGGTFTGPRGSKFDSGATLSVQENATVIINDGDFSKGLNYTLSNKGTLTVKGGTYDQDPSAYVADGYQAVQSGSTWTVTAK